MALVKSVQGLPDPFASFEEKKTDEYGLKIGNRISKEWFNGTLIANGCEYMIRREYVVQNRLAVRAEHDTTLHKNLAKRGDNDLNLLNLDWENINWIEKFRNNVANGISDENYRIDIKCSDMLSVKMREEKADGYRKLMASRDLLENAKKKLGIDLMPAGGIPEDEDELQLLMKIKTKDKIDIGEQILIDYIKKTNGWDFIHQQTNKDAVDVSLLIARCWIDKNDGVKIAYVDPENYIHSQVRKNDFSDKFYEGVVETITISDLRRESDFTENELRHIAKTYAITNNAPYVNYYMVPIEQIVDHKINVLRFAWKTSKEEVYLAKKRKGETIKVSRKSDTFKANAREDRKELRRKLDTWFEGNVVIGCNAIYGYQECENLSRDTMNKAMSPFVTISVDIYQNRLRSFIDNVKVFGRRLQDAYLKLQYILAELRPDTIEIDIDQLAEIDSGSGGSKKAKYQEALNIFQIKGIVLTKRVNMGEDGIKDGAAVNARASAQGSAIPHLLNAITFYYNQIREVSGVNPARDGSLTNDALVGVSKMNELASNTNTKHIVNAAVMFNLKLTELISTRIQSIFTHKEAAHIRSIYENVIGKEFLDAIEVMKDRHLHEFGFYAQPIPTKQEIDEFKQDLSIALQEGSIDVEIKSQAVKIAHSSIELAYEFLTYHRRKRIKQKQEEEMMLSANKSQNDAAASQAKAQYDTQAYGQKKQIDIQYASQLAQIEIMKAKALQDIQQPVADKEFEQEVYLTKIESLASIQKETFKEDRKDKRTEKQATQQSELLDQRHNKKQPIDFENAFADFDDDGI